MEMIGWRLLSSKTYFLAAGFAERSARGQRVTRVGANAGASFTDAADAEFVLLTVRVVGGAYPVSISPVKGHA